MQERTSAWRLVQKITVVEENQGKKLLLLTFAGLSSDIPYKSDNKFNRNTLKLNNLSCHVRC